MRLLGIKIFVATSLAAVVASGLPTIAMGQSGDPGIWVKPLTGAVVRPFVEPRHEFGAGHRGVDLAVTDSDAVVAAGAGVIEFADSVANALHVVLRHPNGWRTSYSFLSTVTVRIGDQVDAGDPIGTCCDSYAHAPNSSGTSLHFGLRIGVTYADPMKLFAPVDLTELVRLAPPNGRQWPGKDKDSIWHMIFEAAGDAAALITTTLIAGGEALVGAIGDLYLAGVDQLSETIAALGLLAGDLANVAMGSLLAARRWAQHLRECDHDPPGATTQENRLMFVAGINSDTDSTTGTTNDFVPASVGYAESKVEWFSYADDDGPYAASDTFAPVEDSARNLAEQLKAMQAESPGEPVDLIAHSLGGVVVQTFLKFYYDSSDPTFPPLGTVVTLDSPHAGAPAASAADLIANSWVGATALDAVGAIPNVTEPSSLVDLSEMSELNKKLAGTALPAGIDFVSIGAPLDWAVPLTSTHLEGAKNWTVAPEALFMQHSAMTTDAAAMTAVSNALAGRAIPCLTLGDFMVAEMVPGLLSGTTHAVGLVAQSELQTLGP